MEGHISDRWDQYLLRLPDDLADIYFTERYARLYEVDGAVGECFVYEDGGDLFLLPYLVKPATGGGNLTLTFESAYGYGGPLSTSADSDFIESACGAFRRAACARGLASGRIRFHPVLGNHRWAGRGWPIEDRSTVGVNLADGVDTLETQMHAKHRNMLSRARRSGLLFEVDRSFARMPEFIAMYETTMKRLGADPAYFFASRYYEQIVRDMSGDGFMGVVSAGDSAVAMAIFLKSGQYGHYHLSASQPEYARLGANVMLVHGGASELQRAGAALLHLGGGTSRGLDDTLLRFKQRFGTGRYTYYRAEIAL